MASIQRVTVILNPSSGVQREGASVDAVQAALRSAGVREIAVLPLEDGLDLKQALADPLRKGTDAVVAAGGDGTVSAVSSALTDTEMPLGVLPTGTLNHFAKDLGIPADLDGAARVIAAGKWIPVDVAKVNDRLFVNNSSIGLYPAIVAMRETLMRQGWPKRVAMLAGVVSAVWEYPNISVRLTSGAAGPVTRTPLVFVGNNRYQFSGWEAGMRTGLQAGVLQVCTVQSQSRSALLRTVLLVLTGHTDAAPKLHIESADEVQLVTLRKRVRVAVDGEVVLMNSPLCYSICPGALRVLASRES